MTVARFATKPLSHVVACLVLSCGSTNDPGPSAPSGGATATGGASASGGAVTGGTTSGGSSSGGVTQGGSPTPTTGGTVTTGGGTSTGGQSSGGSSGGNAAGGAAGGGGQLGTGGALGGAGSASGGTNAGGKGGTASGGKASSTGGTNTGGTARGGSGGSTSGSSGTGGNPTTGGISSGGSTGKGGSAGMPSACIGWASVDAEGVARTTGGEGGQVIQITTAEQLKSYRRDTTPLILRIMNDLTGEFELGSNKTVEGATNNITIHGSLSFSGTTTMTLSNLIVRNLKIDAVSSTEDGMDVRFAHHVCIEHCEFVNGPDGNLDVVSEANYVTIAYNKFYYTSAWKPLPDETSANHRFSNLVGSSNTTELDRGKLKVTFHHNWWADGVVERMPRVRFGDVHVFNNYYSSAGNDYCIAGGKEARLVVENNYFENVANPHEFYDGDTTAQIKASGNEYVNVTGLKDSGQGASFTPPYPYSLDPGASVKANVMANVGPR